MKEQNKLLVLIIVELAIILGLSMAWRYILDVDFINNVILLPFGENYEALSRIADSLLKNWIWDITILLLSGALAAIWWYIRGTRAKIRTPAEVLKWRSKWKLYYGYGVIGAIVCATLLKLDMIDKFTASSALFYFALYDAIVFVPYLVGTLFFSPIVVETAVLFGDRYHAPKGEEI